MPLLRPGGAVAAAALLLLLAAAACAAGRPVEAEPSSWAGAVLPPMAAHGATPTAAAAAPPAFNATALRQQLDALQGGGRPPILFIPPIGGVQLHMQLSGAAVPRLWCPRTTWGRWRLAWLNPAALLPGAFACWADAFKLQCSARGRCCSPAGVEVAPVPGFESAMGALPGAPGGLFSTFSPLVDALEQLGWRRGGDMTAHLYDWRQPPTEWTRRGGSFDQLRGQIEAAVAASGGRPVAALSLSMGSTYFGLFLRAHVSAAWARRHVASHIAVSGVWGGTLWAPLAVVAGGQDPESQALSPVAQLLEHEPLRALLRALPSLPFLSPAPAVFGDRVLVRGEATGQRFTAGRLGAWLRASGTRGAADVWQASWRFMEGGTRASGSPVPLRCLYGTGVDTAEGVTVLPPSEHGPRRYQLQLGDGGGTVPLRSLQVCDRHAGTVRRYPGQRHSELIHSGEVQADIITALLELGQGAGGSSA